MQVVKDYFGNEVSIGDAIIHVVKQSTDVGIHYSIIYGFIWRGNKKYEAKVVSMRRHYCKQDEDTYYRATLTSNNFIRITMDSIPEHIKLGLLNKVKI